MIIFREKKILFITPPKCGSTTLHEFFCEEDNNIYVIGPQLDGVIDKHTCITPFFAQKDYQRYLIVRNPLTRVESIFNHLQCFNNMDKNTFIDEIKEDKIPFAKPISKIYHADNYDNYIKLENMQSALKKLNLPVPPHRLNKSKRKYKFSQEEIESIMDWAKFDLDAFNYETP